MNQLYKELFGVNFKVNELKVKDLPIYVTSRRSFFRLSYSNVDFILIRLSNKEKFGVVALEKQAVMVSSKYSLPVAFSFESISRSQRDSMLERNIPFISDSGQLYLPFLGMALCNKFQKQKEIKSEKMMPVTQTLFLYLLYKSNGKPLMKMDAAKQIGVTKTSITRASEQLSVMGLITQENRGKEYYMMLNGSGIELYKKAQPYLINPVQKTIVTLDEKKYKGLLLSGESALSKKTMLNEPGIPVRAIYKSDIDMEKIREIDIRWEPEVKAVSLELWKYNPTLFAKDGVVDPISLAMCYENNVDERIEGAVEEYLEGYSW